MFVAGATNQPDIHSSTDRKLTSVRARAPDETAYTNSLLDINSILSFNE